MASSRTEVLSTIAEVFGQYSPSVSSPPGQTPAAALSAPVMADASDSRRRAGLIGSDAEQVADVWGAARRELKSKERDLAAAQARQLAEASLARSANSAALRDTVGWQLDEERDRGRFLELQLAELVAQHEHLKAQYGDTLTKLSEALQVRAPARASEGSHCIVWGGCFAGLHTLWPRTSGAYRRPGTCQRSLGVAPLSRLPGHRLSAARWTSRAARLQCPLAC